MNRTALAWLSAMALLGASSALAQEPMGAPRAANDGEVPLGAEQPPSASQGIPAPAESAVAIGEEPVNAAPGSAVLVEIDQVPNLEERGGPSRRQIALMQTTLLNRFSQLGFSNVSEFRREGETYVAEVVDAQGNEATVVLDPVSGTIVARQ